MKKSKPAKKGKKGMPTKTPRGTKLSEGEMAKNNLRTNQKPQDVRVLNSADAALNQLIGG